MLFGVFFPLYRAKLDLTEVAKDGSSPSVSCLNFESRVSKFPVLEASVASSTNATASSPFRWACVYDGRLNEGVTEIVSIPKVSLLLTLLCQGLF